MADRISTLDDGYVTGDLSVYPQMIDDRDTLYEAKNNAETTLKQSLSYTGNLIVVEDASKFPDQGLIRIGLEIIYYAEKVGNVFKDLKRGFVGSRQDRHMIGDKVTHGVFAESHNAVKDAIWNIQHFLGLEGTVDTATFNGRLTALERKFLSPKPLFRGFPKSGTTPLKVRFQNFSNREAVRFLWDFGDGAFSTEVNPEHTYLSEGDFTVQLRMVTSIGGNGVVTKNDYIKIRNDKGLGFMYVTPEAGTTSTTFTFVDQTDGDIVQRHWNFDDGERITIEDPDIHEITHTYSDAGTYNPTLLVIFADQSLKRVSLNDPIIVS